MHVYEGWRSPHASTLSTRSFDIVSKSLLLSSYMYTLQAPAQNSILFDVIASVQAVVRLSSLTLRVGGYLSYHRKKIILPSYVWQYCHSIVASIKKATHVIWQAYWETVCLREGSSAVKNKRVSAAHTRPFKWVFNGLTLEKYVICRIIPKLQLG